MEPNGKALVAKSWVPRVIKKSQCHWDVKPVWSEPSACNNCSPTLLSYPSLIWELCQTVSTHQRTRMGRKRVVEEEREMRWRGWMKMRRTASGWKEDRSEIRVLVFYSQSGCWGVKCSAWYSRLVWFQLETLAAAAAACWLIENSGDLQRITRFPTLSFSFSFRRERYFFFCLVMFLDLYRRVGVTQFKPPLLDLWLNQYCFPPETWNGLCVITSSQHKKLRKCFQFPTQSAAVESKDVQLDLKST